MSCSHWFSPDTRLPFTFLNQHMKIHIWKVWPIHELSMMLTSIMKSTMFTSFKQYHLVKMKWILIDASFLPVDSTVGEVEVGISNLLAMNKLLTKVVSRTMEINININQHGLYKPILTNNPRPPIYILKKNKRYLFFSFQ